MNPIDTHATLRLTAKRLRRLPNVRRRSARSSRKRALHARPVRLPAVRVRGRRRPARSALNARGVLTLSVDEAVREVEAGAKRGVRSVNIPRHKDDIGSAATRSQRPSSRPCRAISELCPISSSSPTSACTRIHRPRPLRSRHRRRDCERPNVQEQLVRCELSCGGRRGPVVAASGPDAMDGRVGAIRKALDERGFEQTVSSCPYAAEALGTTLRTPSGREQDRRLDSATARPIRWILRTSREALREVAQDSIEEGIPTSS